MIGGGGRGRGLVADAHTARPGLLRKLAPLAGTTIAAGPGWDDARLPASVVRVTSLHDAIHCVVRATMIDLPAQEPAGS